MPHQIMRGNKRRKTCFFNDGKQCGKDLFSGIRIKISGRLIG